LTEHLITIAARAIRAVARGRSATFARSAAGASCGVWSCLSTLTTRAAWGAAPGPEDVGGGGDLALHGLVAAGFAGLYVLCLPLALYRGWLLERGPREICGEAAKWSAWLVALALLLCSFWPFAIYEIGRTVWTRHWRGPLAWRYLHGLAEEAAGALKYTADDQLTIGERYCDGRGFAQDHKAAARWFRRAADQGLPEAWYRLATCYSLGQGVRRDPCEAYMWLGLLAGHAEDGPQALAELAPIAAEIMTSLAEEMPPSQIALARERMAHWKWFHRFPA
jgi:Sel1 repeat-containing protein